MMRLCELARACRTVHPVSVLETLFGNVSRAGKSYLPLGPATFFQELRGGCDLLFTHGYVDRHPREAAARVAGGE